MSVFAASPAFADGFSRANTIMEKVSSEAAWLGGHHDHRGRDLDWL